jgi:ribose-phosphate pyrophosphokinase
MPYFGYARQDRKTGGRTPISAKLVANLITRAGADRVLTMDLHAGQIQGFFDIPTDNLLPARRMADDIREHLRKTDDLMIVSPDVGGVVRARALANRLGADLAIVDKRRSGPGQSEVMNIIGDVSGRRCILYDDIVDSAGTLCNAAKALKDQGATEVSAYVTHGVLSAGAVGRVNDSVLKELVVTDSIEPTDEIGAAKKIRIVSCAPLIGEAVRRIANEESVSKLFD